jgi:hypothetical protein
MLAGMRSRFLHSLSLSLAFSAAAWLPVQAQPNGVPASVTSLGFGGNFTNGVRSSVTSLGSSGYGNSRPIFGDCCANFFLPVNPNPPLFSGQRHHRKDKDKDGDKGHKDGDHNFFAISEPVYIPYAVPDAEESDNDSPDNDSPDLDPPDTDYAHGAGPLNPYSLGKRAGNRHPVANPDAVGQAQKPVAAQPPTVLVFRDGRRAEVFNYAVVGDTLFDFAADRTHKILLADLDLAATQKANEDRGVDFQIPADATQ